MRMVNFWTAASPFSRAMTQMSTCWANGQESQSIILKRHKRKLDVNNVHKKNVPASFCNNKLLKRRDVWSNLQRALVMLASLTFWSVVRLLIRTVIICTGMCCTRLARAMDGSKEGSAKQIYRKQTLRHNLGVDCQGKNNVFREILWEFNSR